MDQRLKDAAQAGDIEALYALIREDAFVLKRIDELPIVDTPLHIAASAGHVDFAMEIVNLKASFTRKLNPDGFSPMHLALQNGKEVMVLWLLDVDKDLVRVKARGGKTPLHDAAEIGNLLSCLDGFFDACPESIQDVTNQGDTALHIALRSKKIKAFEKLMDWLRCSIFIDAQFWQEELLNWKNKQGDTLLHIAASSDQIQVVKMLIGKRNVVKDIKNLDGETAMDILRRHLTDRDIRDMQKSASGFLSSLLKSVRFNQIQVGVKERSKITQLFLSLLVYLGRTNKETPRETRDALLLVDTLIVTATYQATLSPPGGVWQGSADMNSHIRISNSTTEATSPHFTGTSVMSSETFRLFFLANTFLFLVTSLRILMTFFQNLNKVSFTHVSIVWLLCSCIFSLIVIAPTDRLSRGFRVVFYFYIAIVVFIL
ncbi:hypothetical protein P3X46_025490 [Hevea brasiliensis]|uniref:PGG domain-containing protein n=1 Tax=Hevea brasiliensis TaxID=3981 RepID=A0ABQ9L5Q4_HEVBR|nr:ankyrin repeat-containing protein BDA1 [Hevea brasiliensis]KAJ9160054.1 hypothetical protein P3X46_025490 [Hevea brasiliensis]